MPHELKEDPALLSHLLDDYEVAQPPWRITSYWRPYHARILRVLEEDGIDNLLSNARLLKGFAVGGTPRLTEPANPLKKRIRALTLKLPIVAGAVAEYEKLLEVSTRREARLRAKLARIALDRISRDFPNMTLDADLTQAGAADLFEWNGTQISAAFAPYLARAADFYRSLDSADFDAFLEIGPGIGWSSLAHAALNPNIRTIVNIDIPSTIYLSTQFLKSTGLFDVVDYKDFKTTKVVEPGAPGRIKLYQLPPWSIEHLTLPNACVHNAASFQEMSPDVVRAYADVIHRLDPKCVWLICNEMAVRDGNRDHQSVSMPFLEDLFAAMERLPPDLKHTLDYGESLDTQRIFVSR